MDANLEIMRMKQEIIESINQHHMPVVVTVLILKEILAEAQTQLNNILSEEIKKEKAEEMDTVGVSRSNEKPSKTTG